MQRDPGVGLELLREALPSIGGFTREVGIGRRIAALALDPDIAEISAGGPQRDVALVEQGDALAGAREAIGHRRADDAAADDQIIGDAVGHDAQSSLR